MQACKISAPIKKFMGKSYDNRVIALPSQEGKKRGEGRGNMDVAVRSTWDRGRAVPLSAVP